MKMDSKDCIYHVYRCSTYSSEGISAFSYSAMRKEVYEGLAHKGLNRYAKIANSRSIALISQFTKAPDYHQHTDL